MNKLGWVALAAIVGCEQGGVTREELQDLRSRVDQVGQAVNQTHAACTGQEASGPEAPAEPEEPEQEPIEGRPDPRSPLAFAPVVRTGRVAATSGESGVAANDRCDVAVWYVDDEQSPPVNCRVRVRCGGREVYGPETGPASTESWGWVLCSVRDGRPDEAFDGAGIANEEDPLLEMDLSANTITVKDQGYEIDVRLDPEAAGPSTGGLPSLDPYDFVPSVRFGQVSDVIGTTPVRPGMRCVVQTWPEGEGEEGDPINGRVNVVCGEVNLFGPVVGSDGDNWGYALVGVRGGQPAMALDVEPTGEHGDPQLELDLFGGRVAVADGDAYRVEITLAR